MTLETVIALDRLRVRGPPKESSCTATVLRETAAELAMEESTGCRGVKDSGCLEEQVEPRRAAVRSRKDLIMVRCRENREEVEPVDGYLIDVITDLHKFFSGSTLLVGAKMIIFSSLYTIHPI
jgi:hypothetical protein